MSHSCLTDPTAAHWHKPLRGGGGLLIQISPFGHPFVDIGSAAKGKQGKKLRSREKRRTCRYSKGRRVGEWVKVRVGEKDRARMKEGEKEEEGGGRKSE